VLGRRNPRSAYGPSIQTSSRTVAETFGVRIYTPRSRGRRPARSSDGTDENQIALAFSGLRQAVTTICFVEGPQEYPIDNFRVHTHFEDLRAQPRRTRARASC